MTDTTTITDTTQEVTEATQQAVKQVNLLSSSTQGDYLNLKSSQLLLAFLQYSSS